MRSMTGYGKGAATAGGREMTVEIKTVNHRFLDVNLRMPRALLFLDDTIRKALASALSRGHADVYVNYQNARDDARQVRVDTPLFHAYMRALDRMAAAAPMADDRSLMRLARLPDVLSVQEKDEDQAAVLALCRHALDEALSALCGMRAREGESLRADLLEKLDRFESLVADIARRAPDVVAEAKARLETRVGELLKAPPDPQRVAQEIAFLADRAAIDEEVVRAYSHLAQARECASLEAPAGRKLDFLIQEMGREINTIGSKASDIRVASLVVDAKAELEKAREQVQNIE